MLNTSGFHRHWLMAVILLMPLMPLNGAVLLTGEVAAKDSETFYAPRISGWQTQIEWMMSEGQIAKPGELVVLFERSSLDADIEMKEADLLQKQDQLALAKGQGEAAIREAEFDHHKAQLELDKAKIDASVSAQFVSRYDFEKNIIDKEKSRLAVEKALRRLHSKRDEVKTDISKKQTAITKTTLDLAALQKKSRLSALKTEYGGAMIYASHPWTGHKLSSGTSVQATWQVAQVASGKAMQVIAWINEVDKAAVAPDSQVLLSFDAHGSQTWRGVVRHIVTQAEAREAWGSAVYFQLEIDFIDTVDVELVPGMSVLVEVL